MWTIVGRQIAQGIENRDVAGIFRAAHGKIYYAVIIKDTPEAITQGSPEARFTGTKRGLRRNPAKRLRWGEEERRNE